MAGILGDLFGLGGGTAAPTPGLLDAAGYMDPAQYDRMRQSQSMMGLWAGLLAGGGPSLSPRNFGSALGAGLTGAQQFGSQFDESQLHGAQAAQARANALKLADDVRSGQLGRQIAAEEIARNRSGGTGNAAPGAGSSTPNFGAGLAGAPGRLASADIYKLATDVGFKGDAAETMTAIIQGESGNRPGAIGDQNIGGSYGLTQINRKAHGDVALEALNNPRRALELAYDISKQGTDFSPWSVYKTGAYKQYLGRTQAPAGGEAVPDFAGGRSLTLPGTLAAGADALRTGPGAAPAPAILAAPGVNPNAAPVDRYGEPAPPGYELVPGGIRARQAAGPVNVRPLAGEAVPAESAAGPSFGYGSAGGAISPAVLAAAAGGAPPVPNAMVAPAPPVPAPAPAGALPSAVAAAPTPLGTQPPGAATAVPGDLYPGLPAIPVPGVLPTPMAPPTPVSRTGGPVAVPALPGPAAGMTASGLTPAQLQQSRSAQNLELAFGLMKIPVPDYLKERAKLEAGGQLAAAQEAATQPYKFQMKLFDDALQNRRDQYNAMDKTQQDQYAASLGMQRDQVKSGFDILADRIKQQTEAALAGPKRAAEDAATRTQDQKEYDSYVKQEVAAGREPLSQFEYMQRLKQAGATTINTAEGLAAAQQRARLDIDTKAAKDAGDVAAAARRTAPLLDEILRIAHSTPAGWAGPISLQMSRALSAAGMPVSEGMSNAEVMRSMNQLLIPTVREPGSSSNADVNNYLAATPGLMNSPDGRIKMASMIKAMGARASEIAAVYRNNVGATDLHEKLAALDAKPLFTDQQRADIEQAAGGGVTKRNPDGSWTTPSGAVVREVR